VDRLVLNGGMKFAVKSLLAVAVGTLASCGGAPPAADLPPDERPASLDRAPAAPPRAPEVLQASLSIEQAIDESFRRNLNLVAQRLNVSLAEAGIVAARVRPNPVLSLDADHINVLNINHGDLTEASVRVDVPIVLGGKRDRRIEVAERDRKIAEVQIEDVLRKLRQDVASACVDLIQAKANIALAKDNLKTFEDLVQLNEKRVAAGAIAPVERTRSKVQLLQFRTSVKRAELDLSGARTRLKGLIGRGNLDGDLDLTDDLKVVPAETVPGLPEFRSKAVASRPDLKALDLGMARSESDLRLQIANGIVDLSAGAEYRWSAQDHSQRLIGLFFSVPLPLNNPNAGEIARAETQRLVASRQRDALLADVYTDVSAAYEELVSARELVRGIEDELLKSAQDVRDAERKRYESGATSFLEFLDAQRAFNDARQGLNDAWATYRRAVIHLQAGVGSEVMR
jgi:cobalt-zinc-cadmium efflux system outer membrane protein